MARRVLELLVAFAAGALLTQHARLVLSHGDDDAPPTEPFLERWLAASGGVADARSIAEVDAAALNASAFFAFVRAATPLVVRGFVGAHWAATDW